MKTKKIPLVVALTVICSGLQVQNVYAAPADKADKAQDNNGQAQKEENIAKKEFGKDHPFAVTDLPEKSKLRKKLESLPPQAKENAMKNLHEFSFPEGDADSLDTDENGDIFYDETQAPKPSETTTTTTTDGTTTVVLPTIDVFKLHSRPNSTKRVFLDFDGHTITATAWNTTTDPSYVARPFDLDNSPTTFSASERAIIAEVWHRVSEDYAPFDIDVTTEQPATFNATTGRVLVTRNVDANGKAMPSSTAGGVAYTNVWARSNYHTYYSPAFIYFNNLGNSPVYMAEAASHEFGHNLGLSHDGVTVSTANPRCSTITAYYCGLGNGFVSWGSIMGVGYYTNVTEWSKGEYPSANNTQDDIAIIAGKLGLISDGDNGSFGSAQPLAVSSTGTIASTNPQNDPGNVNPVNKGIIESATDVDVFWFDAAAGAATITVTPAWAAFPRTSLRGANLDIDARIYDQAGNVVASAEPVTETSATISTTLTGGRYYLTIGGVGNAVTPYTDYGSLGDYFISGTVTK